MSAPELSVIIPCYRQAHFLPRALKSVLAQRGVALEVIVVDDGSPDGVAEVCRNLDGRVVLHRQENQGLSKARNAGIARARGVFLHFLDADDAVRPGMYRAMTRALRAREAWTAAVCGTAYTDPEMRPFGPRREAPPTGRLFEALARESCFPPGAIVLRRAILSRTGTFDPALNATGVWDLWLRLARTGAVFGAVPKPYFLYRLHARGMSRDPFLMFDGVREVLERARRPDPRVRDPAPEYRDGAAAADLRECQASAVFPCLGKAIGSGNAEAARKLVGLLREYRPALRATPRECRGLYWNAAINAGVLPPNHRDVALCAWPALMALGHGFREDTDASRFIQELALTVFGTDSLMRRVEKLEQALPYRAARKCWSLLQYARGRGGRP